MPKGKHKGGRRQFTDFQALEEQREKEERERQWKEKKGLASNEEADSDEELVSEENTSSEEEGESEEADKPAKRKGVEGLIEVCNLNRQVSGDNLSEVKDTKPQLSRREREELERQRAAEDYQKRHREGKTEEARADLERLAIIKQQREAAAKKRDDDKKAKQTAAEQKKEAVAKALNKKGKS